MRFQCEHCGKSAEKRPGDINRSRALGMRLFCGRRCFGLDRRKHKPKAQRVAEKRLYDMEYRRKNAAARKAQKAAYFQATYDPAKARIERKKRAKAHAEYCRRPKYRRWKSGYDRQYRAREFGPFAEAYMMTIDLNREIKERMTNEQIRRENGTWGKRQARARASAEEAARHRPRASHG